MKKRISAMFLCLCIVLAVLPTTSLATEDHVNTLVQHIKKRGNVADGFKYISNEDSISTATITYRSDINCLYFYFTYSVDTSVGTVKQSTDFYYDINSRNVQRPLRYSYIGTQGVQTVIVFECQANLDISMYDETPIKFEKADDPTGVYVFPSEADYNEDANLCLKAAMSAWNLLLLFQTELAGMELKDIGFVKYHTEQGETPSDPPTTLASGECGNNLVWKLDSNGQLTISGTGSMNNYSPGSAAPWNSYRAKIKEVYISNGVTDIGKYAFYYCLDLESVTLPPSVVIIGEGAFGRCSALKNITIPNGIRTIGTSVFANCSNLSSVILPNSIQELGGLVFSGCSALTHVTLSNNISTLAGGTFRDCSSLKEINIPEGVKEIGYIGLYGDFSGCTNLNTVYFPASLQEIGKSSFANCANLKTIYFSGTETQWNQIKISEGNQDITRITPICTGTTTPNPPDIPITPSQPDKLFLSVANGSLGKKISVQITGGHWLTVQTKRGNSITISSVQAPGSGSVTLSFSATAGSSIQVWETETEMTFNAQGVPNNKILATASRTL